MYHLMNRGDRREPIFKDDREGENDAKGSWGITQHQQVGGIADGIRLYA